MIGKRDYSVALFGPPHRRFARNERIRPLMHCCKRCMAQIDFFVVCRVGPGSTSEEALSATVRKEQSVQYNGGRTCQTARATPLFHFKSIPGIYVLFWP
jgi:hypothetical protein